MKLKGLSRQAQKMHPVMGSLASWQMSLSVDVLVYETFTSLMKWKHVTG